MKNLKLIDRRFRYRHFISLIAFVAIHAHIFSQTNNTYSFIVAGHAYGAHAGGNIGLHPKFLDKLNTGFDSTVAFFVFTGDIVNESTTESWNQVDNELNNYGLPFYFAMGNHDANSIGYEVFETKFGGAYYAFQSQNELYIILNSIESDRSISSTQLEFLQNTLDTLESSVQNVFIFFHEVIWNSHEKYMGVKSNSRSRYDQIIGHSNYWTEVHPLLLEYADKEFYLIAGDVGGNTDAIAAFYDKWDNVTLLASGMGEVADENYLLVTVSHEDSISLKVVPLREDTEMKSIEYYSVPAPPAQIYGETEILIGSSNYEYYVDEVFNARSYIWELPENAAGSSTTNSININYSDGFTSGEIRVKAFSEGFGNSVPVSLSVVALPNKIVENESYNKDFQVQIEVIEGGCKLHFKGENKQPCRLNFYDMLGKMLMVSTIQNFENNDVIFDLSKFQADIIILQITTADQQITKKLLIPH